MQMADQLKKEDVVVVIFHDHGTRYIGKMFNDDWMMAKGYLDVAGLTAKELVGSMAGVDLITLDANETIARAAHLMNEHDYSQLPVTKNGRIVGSINDAYIYGLLMKDPSI